MSKHRSLDDDFWKDPKLRKEPMHLRMLLAGLITEAADDEGRFEVEPYGWLDAYFARHDPITEDDIRAAWERLCELGICVEYDAGQHGFLTAWFRRQLVQNPRPSTLPTPDPMDGVVTSRAMMSAVYDLYLKHAGGKGKSWMTVAAHWWASLQPEERLKLVGGKPEEVTSEEQYAKVTYSKILSRLGRDRTGRERTKGNDSAPPAADAPPSALVTPPEPAPKEKPKPTRKPKQHEPAKPPEPHEDTPSQAAANACLALYGLTHQDLGKSAGKYFAAIGSIIKQQTGGAESVLAWAQYELANGQRALGSGTDPVVAIPIEVRAELTAGRWQKTFTAAKEKQRQNTPAPAYDDPQEAARREYAEQHDRLFGGVR